MLRMNNQKPLIPLPLSFTKVTKENSYIRIISRSCMKIITRSRKWYVKTIVFLIIFSLDTICLTGVSGIQTVIQETIINFYFRWSLTKLHKLGRCTFF